MFPTPIGREDSDRSARRRARRRRAAVVPAILSWIVLGAVTVVAASTASSRPPEPLSFAAVHVPATPAPSLVPAAIAPSVLWRADARVGATEVVGDFRPAPLAPDQQRAAFGQPEVDTSVDAKAQSKLPPTKVRARGTATWYCVDGVSPCHHAKSGGMYAAAGAEIRKGDWRGRTVTVCAGSECIRVTLIDWCACAGNRVIDLYGDAFRKLAPLGEGVIPVTVRW